MRTHVFSLFACLVIVTAGACAYGATYYVDPAGDDGYDGSSSSPWLTLQHAVDTIANNDVIIVRAGTYTGCRIRVTGTYGNTKTLQAETPGAVTLNDVGAAALHNGVLELDSGTGTLGGWIVDGFVVDGGGNHRAIYAIETSGITIRNCTMCNSRNTGGGHQSGIYASSSNNVLIVNCVSRDNYQHGMLLTDSADHGIVRGCTVYNNVTAGVYMNGNIAAGSDGQMTDWTIEKNTLYGNVDGFVADGVDGSRWYNNLAYNNSNRAVHLTGSAGATGSQYNNFFNNTFVLPLTGYYCFNITLPNPLKMPSMGNSLRDNILYNYNTAVGRGSICVAISALEDFDSDFNVVMNSFGIDENATIDTLTQWRALGYDRNSIQATDTALFVNPGANDFHLKAGSPAINAGATQSEVTTDKDGVARPQSSYYDIGCYEKAAAGQPTYQYVANDPEASTASTTYQARASMTMNPAVQDDWIIFGFCEFRSPNANYATYAQLFIDGVGEGQNTRKPVDPTDYMPFITVKVVNLAPGAHTVKLMYRAGSSSAVAYIRNARVCAVRKAALEFYNVARDGGVPLTQTLADTTSLTWTPSTNGSYLIVSTAELNATTTVSTRIQTIYSDVVNDEGYIRAADNGDFTTYMSFNYINGVAGVPVTHKIAASKMGPDPINHYIRRARILALRLTGGRFAAAAAAYGTEQTTISAVMQQCLTYSWTQGINGDWLLLNSARLNNSSTSYQTDVQVQLNDTYLCGRQLMRPKHTSDLLNYSSIDIRRLTTSRKIDMDFRTSNPVGRAKVKRLRFYGLPLNAQ